MKTTAKRIIGAIPGTKLIYRKLRSGADFILYYGDKYRCPICNKSFKKFFDGGLDQDILKRYKVIGGGKRKNCKCPACGSLERHRLEYLYFKTTKVLSSKCKVLHFAPEPIITNVLNKNPNIEYISGDIKKEKAMQVVNITDICFEDETFDYIICNHVMEHIPDEAKAFSEIFRVLKNNGQAILMVPVSPILEETLETTASSGEERLKIYGQKDHVRLYGLDFPERMKKAGFHVKTYTAGTDVAFELVTKYALRNGETVFIGQKLSN